MTKLKEYIKEKLTKKEIELLPTSFDVVGDIAIFNSFPKELTKKEKLIANSLMKLNKQIKVVCKKTKKFSGRLRTQKLKIIAGEKRKITIHRENNSLLSLDVEKCYFSPRSATERLRIAKSVKQNEKVLVLFSGIAPFVCVIAKNSNPSIIYGIELNKIAHNFAIENIRLNKINNVILIKGDVKKQLPKLKEKFDRIIMPLPKKSEDYLSLARNKIKNNGIIHLYLFASEREFEEIKQEYSKRFKKVKLLKTGQYAPGVFRICLDLSFPRK